MLSVTPLFIAGNREMVASAKPLIPSSEVPTLRLRSGQATSKIARDGAASVINRADKNQMQAVQALGCLRMWQRFTVRASRREPLSRRQ